MEEPRPVSEEPRPAPANILPLPIISMVRIVFQTLTLGRCFTSVMITACPYRYLETEAPVSVEIVWIIARRWKTTNIVLSPSSDIYYAISILIFADHPTMCSMSFNVDHSYAFPEIILEKEEKLKKETWARSVTSFCAYLIPVNETE